MFNYEKGTMSIYSQESKYVENIRYNGNNEQEIKRDRWKQISANVYVYEKKTMTNEEYDTMCQQYNQNKHKHNNNRHKQIAIDDHKNQIKSYCNNKYHSTSKETLAEYTDLSEHNMEQHVKDIEMQQKKTPISRLNEWAMRGGNTGQKKIAVSYIPIAIGGFAHKPMFTFMCQVLNKKTKGEGLSKKEAKQEAAAQMLKIIFKDDSITSSEKNITSTTVNDNFEINEIDTDNLTSTEGSQIADSDMSDNEMQYSKNYEAVQIGHCEMNPVGALQELVTKHKWASPVYSVQKISESSKNRNRKAVSYKVTCQIFHLQTTGTANKQKNAKRMAARMMFDQIRDMSTNNFQELKSNEFQILSHDNDYKQNNNCNSIPKESKESHAWASLHILRLCFKTAVVNSNIMEWSKLYSFFENDTRQQIQQNVYQLEQSIVQHNSDSTSAVDKLQTLCEELGFQAIYIRFDSVFQPHKDVSDGIGENEEYIIILQVNTIPVTITVGRAVTINMAKEVAAKCVLNTFKTMLFSLSTSSKISSNIIV